MNATDVLAQYGTWALMKFVGALVLFMVLHLMRLPVRLLLVMFEAAMSRVDNAVTAAVSRPTPRPGDRQASFVAEEGTR